MALDCRISLIKKKKFYEDGLKQPKVREKLPISSPKVSDIERGQKYYSHIQITPFLNLPEEQSQGNNCLICSGDLSFLLLYFFCKN